ncbi:MAG: hypothetical protein ACRCZH_08325, partial [Cetobacterium sp.]
MKFDKKYMLGASAKEQKRFEEFEVAANKIIKFLTEKEAMDFENFVSNVNGNVPRDVEIHFKGAIEAMADCKKFSIPQMRRRKENEVIQAVKLDLKRVSEFWEPQENLVLFTLLHEVEQILCKYTGIEAKFPEKYIAEIGRERGFTKEKVKIEGDKIKTFDCIIPVKHEVIFLADLHRKFKDTMNNLSSSAVSILKFNDSFIDFDKLNKHMDERLAAIKKCTLDTYKELPEFDFIGKSPEWLIDEYNLNVELMIRSIYAEKMFVTCREKFDKKIQSSLRGTLTRFQNLVKLHKGLILGEE